MDGSLIDPNLIKLGFFVFVGTLSVQKLRVRPFDFTQAIINGIAVPTLLFLIALPFRVL
jgi:hypothetical protein